MRISAFLIFFSCHSLLPPLPRHLNLCLGHLSGQTTYYRVTSEMWCAGVSCPAPLAGWPASVLAGSAASPPGLLKQQSLTLITTGCRTDKEEKKIFLINKEIQSGAVAKSYMRKGFLIYEEMRKYLPIYEEAVSHIWLCNCSILNFDICE